MFLLVVCYSTAPSRVAEPAIWTRNAQATRGAMPTHRVAVQAAANPVSSTVKPAQSATSAAQALVMRDVPVSLVPRTASRSPVMS